MGDDLNIVTNGILFSWKSGMAVHVMVSGSFLVGRRPGEYVEISREIKVRWAKLVEPD